MFRKKSSVALNPSLFFTFFKETLKENLVKTPNVWCYLKIVFEFKIYKHESGAKSADSSIRRERLKF